MKRSCHNLLILVATLALATLFSGRQGMPEEPRGRGWLILTVPEQASVYINGRPTKSTGSRREYYSDDLVPGQNYRYAVQVFLERNGRKLSQQYAVLLQYGQTRSLSVELQDLRQLAVVEQSRPETLSVLQQRLPYGPALADKPTALPVLAAPPSMASEVAGFSYSAVPLSKLTVTEGTVPENYAARPAIKPQGGRVWESVRIDGEGEGYLTFWQFPAAKEVASPAVVVRTSATRSVTGQLALFSGDGEKLTRVRFVIPAKEANNNARRAFYEARQAHYQQLLKLGIPGGAWFRHQARDAQSALREGALPITVAPSASPQSTTDLMWWYAFVTGGRAISENLSLEQQLPDTASGAGEVPMHQIGGIAVRGFDWDRLVDGRSPVLDPLASIIPADQHAVFFPSVQAALNIAETAAGTETVLLRLAQPRVEHARIQDRYERQFCLALNRLAAILTADTTRSVAVTGSDPYVGMGTDVAVLFESPEPAKLAQRLQAEIEAVSRQIGAVVTVHDEIDSIPYYGVQSADRRVSSYVMSLHNVAVVTNSRYQLKRLVQVAAGEKEPLAKLPEYVYFRDRYRLSEGNETALLVISDATIRRWCGPQWRIGQARRIWNAAVLAEYQASFLQQRLSPRKAPLPAERRESPMPLNLDVGVHGVYSPRYGSLEFMTPLVELPLDWASRVEEGAYIAWRNQYVQNWRWAFDPIAVRLEVTNERLAADLTVIPLIVRSDYAPVVSIVAGAEIRPEAGDPHDALLRGAMAVDKKSPTIRMMINFARMMVPSSGLNMAEDPFDWFGQTISIHLEDDPHWQELAAMPPEERRALNKGPELWLPVALQLPVELQMEVTSGLKLTKFLAGLRTYLEETAPGMLRWELRTYREEPYTRLGLGEIAKGEIAARDTAAAKKLESLGLFYAASGDALVVAMRENVLQRTLDRRIARREAAADGHSTGNEKTPAPGKTPPPPVGSWPGKHLAVHADHKLLELIAKLAEEPYQLVMQRLAWSNLPILNEWKRLYPDRDPLAVHEELWHTRLVCPGGGAYVWNPQWQTMESTVYGHPGEPKIGPAILPALDKFKSGDFGLTFENQGLRAMVILELDRADTASGNASPDACEKKTYSDKPSRSDIQQP